MPSSMKNQLPRGTPLNPYRKAIVVGASSGIGAALAKELARQGCLVALLARRETLLQEICSEINQAAGETRAFYLVHDVRNVEEVDKLFPRILGDLGGLDLILYNSGLTLRASGDELEHALDSEMLAVNLAGAVAWLDAAANLFMAAGSGQIVGISSVAGERGRMANPVYNASKAGLTCYLEGLRNRLSRRGVHVLTVIPGYVDTSILEGSEPGFLVSSPEQAARRIAEAIRRRKQVVYVSSIWRWIMLIIRIIPSVIFRRLSI